MSEFCCVVMVLGRLIPRPCSRGLLGLPAVSHVRILLCRNGFGARRVGPLSRDVPQWTVAVDIAALIVVRVCQRVVVDGAIGDAAAAVGAFASRPMFARSDEQLCAALVD